MLIIIVLLAVLGGGGFMMMKKKGGKKEAPPAPKLAKKKEDLEEFLVNLRGSTSYLKCKIGLGVAEGSPPKMVEEEMPVIRDTILMILMTKTPSDIDSPEEKIELKEEIRFALNKALTPKEAEKSHDKAADNSSEKQKSSSDEASAGEKKASSSKGEKSKEENPVPGPQIPVLEVYFTAFATS